METIYIRGKHKHELAPAASKGMVDVVPRHVMMDRLFIAC